MGQISDQPSSNPFAAFGSSVAAYAGGYVAPIVEFTPAATPVAAVGNAPNYWLALIAALGILLIAAAITDLRARIISNRLNLGVAALAPLWWIACGLPPAVRSW